MIIYFGTGENVSVVYDKSTLTQEQFETASLTLEEEPLPEVVEGHYATRFIDPITKIFSWIYKIETPKINLHTLQALVNNKILTQGQADELLM